jgi:RNA polymerase sigma factor (sigma-70 family)
MSDAQAIEATKTGNIAAFTHLVEKYQYLAYSIVRKVIRNKEEAEEITQDIFLQAFKKIDELRDPDKFKPWLCRIALNSALSKYNKQKPIHINVEYLTENINETVVNEAIATMEEDSRKRIIQQAFQVLQPDDRILLELYYLEEMSLREVSEITQLSLNNVKIKLYRIRKRLYSILNKIKS